jgi:uncharacterized protein with HEPN domain
VSAAYRTIDHLAHMRRAAGDACGFLAGLDRAAFDGDLRTQRAVLMSLVILGEAATQLMERDPDFVANHPAWPWRAMRGMRNRIAHGYFEVQLDLVWTTVTRDLPALLAHIDELPPIG